MADIRIETLTNNEESIKLISSFIEKDVNHFCFFNFDEDFNIIPPTDMAENYFTYASLYGIKLDEKPIGLIALYEGELGIFIEEEYRHQGIAKKALIKFLEEQVREMLLEEVTAEVVYDNSESLGLFRNLGFEESPLDMKLQTIGDEKRLVTTFKKAID